MFFHVQNVPVYTKTAWTDKEVVEISLASKFYCTWKAFAFNCTRFVYEVWKSDTRSIGVFVFFFEANIACITCHDLCNYAGCGYYYRCKQRLGSCEYFKLQSLKHEFGYSSLLCIIPHNLVKWRYVLGKAMGYQI